MKLSDSTSISLPARNLLAILAAVAIGTMSYFTIIERLNSIESDIRLMHKDLEAANAFKTSFDLFLFAANQNDGLACVIAIGLEDIFIASNVDFSAE